MKLAILTYHNAPELTVSDRKLIPILTTFSINVSFEVWNNKETVWSQYDYLLFRSTWDYYLDIRSFEQWLDTIEKAGIRTINPIQTIRWNSHKFYLSELRDKGVLLIPSVFVRNADKVKINNAIPDDWSRFVIKPAISAGSYLTKVFNRTEKESRDIDEYWELLKVRDVIIQEYFEEVENDGEYSFIFFNGNFSHAVQKIPSSNDFRVQSQFGGKYQKISPPDELIQEAEKILTKVSHPWMYARVDGIIRNECFHLMELELIEPDLYFDYEPEATERFVRSLMDYLRMM